MESVAEESTAAESAGAAATAAVESAADDSGAGTLLDETSAELDCTSALEAGAATLELETATELDDGATTTLELDTVSLLETDWAASASNSANRSRGWAKALTDKRLATQAIRENLRIQF